MNGLEKILAHILKESDAECAVIEKEAAAECERIRASYEKAEQDEYWKLVNEGTKEAERRLERLNSLAALEAKKHVLMTQQEMLTEAFSYAAKKLLELPGNEYTGFLAKQAYSASLSGTETIILSPTDRERYGRDVLELANSALSAAGKTANLSLSDKTADISGGLILSGGDIEVNCSIDALIAECRNRISPEVASVLFD